MTLRHLQIFKTVCERMSITAAADALNMTQPAVSIAIRELESFYAVKLFDRIGRRIYLTDAGRSLMTDAEAILSRFESSVRTLRGGEGPAACRIGANATAAECFLAPLVTSLRKAVPTMAFSVFIGNSGEVERRIAENAVDFALLDAVDEAANCTRIPLSSVEMEAVCAPVFDCPPALTVSSLARQPLLLRETGSGARRCVDAVLESNGCKAVPAAEGTTNLGLLRLAESGFGVAVLPAALVQPSVAAGKLRRVAVLDGVFSRRYDLIFLTRKYRSPAMEQVLAAVQTFFSVL